MIMKREKMTEEINRKIILAMVAEIFKLDYKKADLWMQTPNPNLGHVSPDRMISSGNVQQLYDFVENCMIENKRKE